jgi:hypothetical protein
VIFGRDKLAHLLPLNLSSVVIIDDSDFNAFIGIYFAVSDSLSSAWGVCTVAAPSELALPPEFVWVTPHDTVSRAKDSKGIFELNVSSQQSKLVLVHIGGLLANHKVNV